jgi:predicted 3-demethylubiquinone-9 3-methyltransferase (glyoxalase superfamily)
MRVLGIGGGYLLASVGAATPTGSHPVGPFDTMSRRPRPVRHSYEIDQRERSRNAYPELMNSKQLHHESMKAVTPCLWFAGDAEEAAKFYVSLLPNSRIDAVFRSPADTPGGPAGSVLTVEFNLNGCPFLALNGDQAVEYNHAVSFQIHTRDQAETDRVWSAVLANGGKEVQCGWITDRWGLSWQIVPERLTELIKDPDPVRARRAMEAMMTMVKIDIAALEKAAG